MISCIYEIRNKINNKIYIGSTVDFKKRKATHLKELRQGKHANSHLQNAWNKYGEDNFSFKIIERCSIENLLIREQYYINLFYGENCYNIQKIACNNISNIKNNIYSIYDKNGSYLLNLSTIEEVCEYVNRKSTTVINIVNERKLIANKYYVKTYKKDKLEKSEMYVDNSNLIYLLDDNDIIINTFKNIEEVCIYIFGKKDRQKQNRIAWNLQMLYKVNNYKLMYEYDYINFNGKYPKDNLKVYKFILQYNVEGILIGIYDNIYGLKFSVDKTKINTRIKLLQKSLPYKIYKDGYIYFKSDEIIDNIDTGITIYSYIDIHSNLEKKFVKQTELLKDLDIKKSIYEYYFKTHKIYNKNYIFKKYKNGKEII